MADLEDLKVAAENLNGYGFSASDVTLTGFRNVDTGVVHGNNYLLFCLGPVTDLMINYEPSSVMPVWRGSADEAFALEADGKVCGKCQPAFRASVKTLSGDAKGTLETVCSRLIGLFRSVQAASGGFSSKSPLEYYFHLLDLKDAVPLAGVSVAHQIEELYSKSVTAFHEHLESPELQEEAYTATAEALASSMGRLSFLKDTASAHPEAASLIHYGMSPMECQDALLSAQARELKVLYDYPPYHQIALSVGYSRFKHFAAFFSSEGGWQYVPFVAYAALREALDLRSAPASRHLVLRDKLPADLFEVFTVLMKDMADAGIPAVEVLESAKIL